MITRDLLGSRILAIVLVASSTPKKNTCFQPTLTLRATRQHPVWREATTWEPSSYHLLFFLLWNFFYLNLLAHQYILSSCSFRGLPVSHYREINRACYYFMSLTLYNCIPSKVPHFTWPNLWSYWRERKISSQMHSHMMLASISLSFGDFHKVLPVGISTG